MTQHSPQAEPATANEYLGYDEAARYLGVKINTLYGWVHDKSIPHYRISGRCCRFKKSELRAWMAAKAVPAAVR